VKRYRRLRRLVPDAELLRRRASGATLRQLAADYDVAHTTLGRYFGRPAIAKELRELRQSERREALARRAEERQLLRKMRQDAKAQVELEAERAVKRAILAERRAARGRPRSDHEAWLDERDAREPLTRADLHSHDALAAEAVAAGGGLQGVVEASGLGTLANVGRSIDPAILVRAIRNDAAAKARASPVQAPLRRLVPDAELMRRQAAGESLRQLAPDYSVNHTTLSRYFRRPEVTKQLRDARRPRRAEVTLVTLQPAASGDTARRTQAANACWPT